MEGDRMNYEAFFEEELAALSDDSEEQIDDERDNFLEASIAQLKRDLQEAETTSEGNVANGDRTKDGVGDDWAKLLRSVEQTKISLDERSLLIDSKVEITPRPNDTPRSLPTHVEVKTEAQNTRWKQEEEIEREETENANIISNEIDQIREKIIKDDEDLQLPVHIKSEEEIRAEIQDMLSEMLISVEYIHSLAKDTSLPYDVLEGSSSLLADPIKESSLDMLKEAKEFEEPDILLQEVMKDTEEDSSHYVYHDLLNMDSNLKKTFEMAISTTEERMREKEEEYNHAIEEDRRRREERRRKRREMAMELERKKSIILIQTQWRRFRAVHMYNRARERKKEELAAALARKKEAEREMEVKHEEESCQWMQLEDNQSVLMNEERLAEEMSTSLLEVEDDRSHHLRERLLREEQERQQLLAEEKRLLDIAKAEEEKRLAAERNASQSSDSNANQQKDSSASKKRTKKGVSAEDTDGGAVVPKKTSWGGLIQKAFGFGSKKAETTNANQRDEEKDANAAIETDVDNVSYDEYFIYSDDDANSEVFGEEESGDISSDEMESLEREDIFTPNVLTTHSSADAQVHIERSVQLALERCKKKIKLHDFHCTSGINHISAKAPARPLEKVPYWVVYAALEHWSSTENAKRCKDLFSEVLIDVSNGMSGVFQQKLDMSVESLSDITVLKQYSGVDALDINVNSIRSLRGIDEYSKDLVYLSVKDNKLRDLSGLEHLEALEVLLADSNQLESLNALHDLQQLREVSATMNSLAEFPLLTCSRLQKLELYRNRIEHVYEDHLRSLSSLTHLDLGRNSLSIISGSALSQCPLLSQLVLSQNQLTEVPHPLHLPNLRKLWVSGNKLTNLDAWASQPSMSFPVFLPLLEKLYLQDNQIESFGTYALATSPYITEVDLSFNNIRKFSQLSGIVFCKHLKVLQLQDNPVNSERGLASILHYFLPEANELSGQTVTSCSSAPPLFSSIKPFLVTTGDDMADGLITAESMMLSKYATKETVCSVDSYETDLREACRSMVLSVSGSDGSYAQDCSHDSHATHLASRLLMSLARMNSEHAFTKSKERFQSSSTGTSHENPTFSIAELSRQHLLQLLCWSPHNSEKVLLFRQPSCRRQREKPRKRSRAAVDREEARYGHAAIRLQACLRGYLLRRKMQSALRGATYEDDELEAMLQAKDGFMAEYGSILNSSEAPELSDSWLQPLSEDVSSEVGETFVYGDHRRRRRSADTTTDAQVESEKELQPFTPERNGEVRRSPRALQASRDSRSGVHASGISNSSSNSGDGYMDSYKNITATVNEWVTGDDFSSQAPLSSATFHEVGVNRVARQEETFDSRPASRSSNISSSSSRYSNDLDERVPLTGRSSASARSNLGAYAARHRNISHARDKQTDPTSRYEAFVKNTEKFGKPVESCFGNTSKSGSFGGKPKVVRKAKKGKKSIPPAWLNKEDA